MATGKFWVNNHAHIVRGNDHASTRFLCYVLQDLDITPFLSGSTRPKLTQRDLNRIVLPCPALDEQRRIAAVLGALDDKIELNRKMNRTLEELAQAIFKSWFIDFDGVPDSEMVESELGPIPRGWEVKPLSAIAHLQTTSVKPFQSPERFWEHYSIPAFDDNEAPTLDAGATIKSNKHQVPPSAVLISKLNPRFPRIWMPDVLDVDAAICSTEFMPFVPVRASLRPFLFDLLRGPTFHTQLLGMVSGTTGSRQRVKPKEIAALTVVLPPDDVLDDYIAAVASLHQRRIGNGAESRTLAGLRDALLPKLISGEIRVPEAEAAVEVVL